MPPFAKLVPAYTPKNTARANRSQMMQSISSGKVSIVGLELGAKNFAAIAFSLSVVLSSSDIVFVVFCSRKDVEVCLI